MTWIDALPLAELVAKGKALVRHAGQRSCSCIASAARSRAPTAVHTRAIRCAKVRWLMAACLPAIGTNGNSIWRPVQRSSAGRRQAALAGIARALEGTDQQRLARETARLVHIGGDPADAVAVAVAWLAERLEFGTTHAIA
jgi:hypothetical protein